MVGHLDKLAMRRTMMAVRTMRVAPRERQQQDGQDEQSRQEPSEAVCRADRHVLPCHSPDCRDAFIHLMRRRASRIDLCQYLHAMTDLVDHAQ